MIVKKYQTRNIVHIIAVFMLSLIFWIGSVVPTQAAENLGITIGSTSGQAGSQVSVNINLSNVAGSTAGTAGLVSTNFAITYDQSVLQVANVTPGSLFTAPSDLSENKTAGKIVFLSQDSTMGDNPITTDGVYATIAFNILPTAATGDSTIVFAASPLQADSVTSTYTINSLRVSPTSGKVTVTGGTVASNAKSITGFTFAGLSPAVAGTINGTNITVTVAAGTSVTTLVPSITVSPNATVAPASAVAQNFTNPVTYTVTAQDGTTQTYTVTVTVAAPQSIAITTPATKLSYNIGENLDITGLVVSETYSDGSTKEEPITAANVSGFNSAVASANQVLTITVNGQTVTFKVQIAAAAPTNGNTAPNIIIYQDTNGNYISVYYLNALSNAPMKMALEKGLLAAELANLPIIVIADNGSVINYEAAIDKSETYAAALNDSTVNHATAPVPIEQLNVDGTVTQIAQAATAAMIDGTMKLN